MMLMMPLYIHRSLYIILYIDAVRAWMVTIIHQTTYMVLMML